MYIVNFEIVMTEEKKGLKQNDDRLKTVLRKKEVYVSLILTMIIAITILSIFYYFPNENEPCIQGISGNSYKDCLMNFEIIRPNPDWKFHYDFNVNVPKFEILFLGQSIVERVLIERTNNEHVVVIVYDDKFNLDLRKLLETEISMASATNLPIHMIYDLSSENKKEDKLTIEIELFNNLDEKKVLKIFKEKIIKKDELVYVIYSQIRSTDNVSERTLLETNEIFSSFKFL